MKTHIIPMLSLMVISGFPLTGVAQEQDGGKIVFTKTDTLVREILNKEKQEDIHAIPVPRFVVKSQNNNFIMAIGGQINTIFGYDIGNNLYDVDAAGGNFVTSQIPVPSTRGKKGDFFINPFNANVDLQIVGLPDSPDKITGYLKFGTGGNNTKLYLKRAYVSYRGFTVGQKLTLFQDTYAAQPPTIDNEGPSGTVSTTAYEINYTSPSFNGFRFAVGIDKPAFLSSDGIYKGRDYPKFDGEQVSDYADASQLVPDIPLWVEYAPSDVNRIRLSGIIRNFSYRNLVKDKTEHLVGWGVMLSGNLQPVKPLTLYLQAVYGKGIGNYIQDISYLSLSFIPKDNAPGKMTASPMMGINFGASLNLGSRWQINAMCSEARIWKVGNYCLSGTSSELAENYKYGLYVCGNVFYNITSYLQWGMEYLWGRRQTWSGIGANDNRIQTQLMFTL